MWPSKMARLLVPTIMKRAAFKSYLSQLNVAGVHRVFSQMCSSRI